MLKILHAGDTYDAPCALLLGGFDGLTLGHVTLIEAARHTGLPIGLTTVLGGKGGSLFTRCERENIFENAGASFVFEIFFSDVVKNTAAETFLSCLFSRIYAKAVFCGEDFRFGKDALGTPELLKTYAPCPVEVLPLLETEEGKIAVSACKTLLASGDLKRLNALLAHPYFIRGTVEHGREVGRTYGFPTLNLTPPPEKSLPPDGVYGGLCATPKGNFPTIVNIGARPTFGVEEKKIEAYLDGFSGDLYGETVRIYPTEFYRGVERFPSAEALKTQLQADIQRLRRFHV